MKFFASKNLAVRNNVCNFACKRNKYLQYMKRDNSPVYEAEKDMMAAEPLEIISITERPRNNAEPYCITPGLPQSVAEALAGIEEGEREFERNETFSHREVMQMVWGKINSYAGKVQ